MNITVAHRRTAPIDGRPPVAREQLGRDRLGQEAREDLLHPLLFQVVQAPAVEARSDPRTQDRGIERLGQEILGAGLDAPDDGAGVLDPRDHDHRDVAESLVVLEALEHLDAVQAGHLDVEQDQVGRFGLERRERVEAVLELDRAVPVVLEMLGEQSAIQRIVIDDRDRGGRRSQTGQAAPRGVGPARRRRVFERLDSLTLCRGLTTRNPQELRGRDLLVGVDEREGGGGALPGAVVGLDVEAGAGLGERDRHPDVADVLLQAR